MIDLKQYQQTGRTTRMLLEAQRTAIQNPHKTFYVVFPTTLHADEIKKRRVPSAPSNMRFIGASNSFIEFIHFNDSKITVKYGGTFDAFIDHDVVEKEMVKLVTAFNRWAAKPGEYGYKENPHG